ncbi:MAG: efflux RND transporter periplasmic adaptor subunit [Gammaproteobacteria bacterium]|nr:efflux RND transporter periplasmic adaptor subunit [Gammaproteobacteria bacterium]
MPRSRLTQLAAAALCAAAAQAAAAPAAPVEVAKARLEPVVVQVPLTGTITARDRAQLSSRVSGLVAAVHVTAGDAVAQGDLLLTLDPTLDELALAEARAASAEGRAALAEARRVRQEARELGPRRGIPESEIRAAEAAARIEEAKLERLLAVERRREEIVARHQLYAPFAGVVSRRLAEEGEWVETGQPVFEVVGTERLRLDLRVPQEHYPHITADTPVVVRLDALPHREISGRIIARVPVSDPDSRTFLLRVGIDDGAGGIIAGMSARATLRIPADERAVTVPRDAVLRDAYGATRVWTIGEEDGAPIASQRRVDIGRSFDGRTEIRSGVEAGERVVVRGNETLSEGQPVRIVNGD